MPSTRYNGRPVSWKDFFSFLFRSIIHNLTSCVVTELKTDKTVCFIVGCGHSGTTLLSAKLGNHPDVYNIGRETKIFLPNKGLYCSREIVREWCFAAEQLEKSHVLEKTPKHVQAVERIKKILPDAKIVFIVRNPLDNCVSLYNRYKNMKIAVKRYIQDNKATRKMRDAYPMSSYLVKYEDLTEHPEQTFKEVCKFLGLEWNSNILNQGETVYNKKKITSKNIAIRRDQVNKSIKPNTGKWRVEMSLDQIIYIKHLTSSLAKHFGYDDEFYKKYEY